MRILIAEDDVTSRTVLAAVLAKTGYEVVQTANGAEAWLELQKPGAPELAILDWVMPDLDGVDIVRRVRALPTDRPPYLIMLTSRDGKADVIAGLDAGANDYLAKPFHQGELQARVAVGRRLIEMQNELLKARNALAHEATHDPLTGVLNRRALEAALTRELAREQRRGDGLAVGLCDIDHFKRINDTYGHIAGDEVLCAFARLLEGKLRQYDHLGRFGGEEFLVIAPGISADAPGLFERLRLSTASCLLPTRSGPVAITVSIGVRIVRHEDTMDRLLAAVDSALYQAKREGRNRVCFAAGEPAASPSGSAS